MTSSLAVSATVVDLDPASLRIKRFSALTTMTLPLIGTGVAVRLLWTGRFTAVDLVLFVVFYAIHVFGVTIGLHRYLAHKAFKTSRWFEDVLMIAGSMAAEGPLLFWVATHRRHHRFADREGDPHSPNLHGAGWRARLRGLWYAHMPWMLSEESSKWAVFAPDVLRDRRLVMHHRLYPVWVLLGLALPTAIGFAIGHTAMSAFTAFVFGGLARVFVANQAAWCVGSVCHAFGSRPFDNRDRSANNWMVAVLTFGEGLQNNHHAFPGSFRHATRWWEPDLSGWLIAGLGRVGVVSGLREPDAAAIARRRTGGSDMFGRAKAARRPDGPPTEESVRQWLIGQLAEKLAIRPEEVDTGKGFEEYGLDSRVGIQMSGKLEKFVERRLSPALLFEYPSIDALAAHLADELRLPERA